ncbi:MAG: hypothetical protein H0U04_18200, partial [Rubrobacter sp.]|nr:hypothetical protein [Rubrobacter sp.]
MERVGKIFTKRETNMRTKEMDQEVKRKHGTSELDRARISRGKFLGFGLSAALISSGVAPFVAKAQT